MTNFMYVVDLYANEEFPLPDISLAERSEHIDSATLVKEEKYEDDKYFSRSLEVRVTTGSSNPMEVFDEIYSECFDCPIHTHIWHYDEIG